MTYSLAIAALPLLVTALAMSQDEPDSRNPTRDRQPPAIKDDDEMQKPGIASDGALREPAREREIGATMSEPMQLRCWMLMMMKVNPYAPAGLLALRDDLNLTDGQVEQLQKILDEALAESRAVLNDQQRQRLSGLSETPDTTMGMHEVLMQRQHERQHGTSEKDTRKDGPSARRIEERPRHHCPVMQAMRTVNPGRADRDPNERGRGVQQSIDVVLRDFAIDMPETLRRGIVRLRVTNTGNGAHNLEIKDEGIERRFSESLEPAETRTMHVHLRPGTYKVYCPIEDLAERGMRMTLTVTGDESR